MSCGACGDMDGCHLWREASGGSGNPVGGGRIESRSLAAIRRYRIDADRADRDNLVGIEMLRTWLRGLHFQIVGIDAQSMNQDEIAEAIGEWPRGSKNGYGRSIEFTVRP